MFHKLRLKLTLFNASIILMLFLLLIVGSYHFSRSEMAHHSEELAHRIMADIESGVINELPPRRSGGPPPGPNFFFVKVSSAGEILLQSFNQPLPADSLTELVKEALSHTESHGALTQEDQEYSFWKETTKPDNNTIVLLQDMSHDKNLLRIQLTALILTGLICLALSLVGSFFMANRAMGPIQKAWQRQIDFVSDASHELRTPLSIIQTNLEIVLENQAEPVAKQMHWLSNIQEETLQMARLVDSLLFLARSDSHQQLLDKRRFDFGKAIAQAAMPFAPLAAAKGVTLSVAAEPTATAYGDELRIKQVIGILLDNAIRHTQDGGTVAVGVFPFGTENIVTVADSGEGINKADLTKIFDRFYQTDKARSHGGAGLGLAIARCIVEAHSGTIQVASTIGKGTTFSIHFPNVLQQ